MPDFCSRIKLILEKYLNTLGFSHSQDEIDYIYNKLITEGFEQREESFRTNVLSIRKELEYQQLVESLNSLWKKNSGSKSIIDWCNKYGIPIQWVLRDKEYLISTLRACQEGSTRDIAELNKCVNELEVVDDFEVLRSQNILNTLFLEYICTGYSYFMLHRVEDLKNYLRKNISSQVYNWAGRSDQVRYHTKEFIKIHMKNEIIDKAQNSLEKMSETDVRHKIKLIMENNPELCMCFLDEF